MQPPSNTQAPNKVQGSSEGKVGRLGDRLVQAGIITTDQLGKALEEQKRNGGILGSNLIKLGYISEGDLSRFLSKQYGFPAIDLSKIEISPELLKLVPLEVVQKQKVLPVSRAGSTLVIATSDPTNYLVFDDIKFLTGYNIDVVVTGESSLKDAINKYYDQSASLMDVMNDLEEDDHFEVLADEEDIDVS